MLCARAFCVCVCERERERDYLQRVSEKFRILRSMERDIFINVHRSSCKVPAVMVTFQLYINFLDTFSKNPEISDFMNVVDLCCVPQFLTASNGSQE